MDPGPPGHAAGGRAEPVRQITTLDNQTAYIQIGQRVPRITGSMSPQLATGGIFNTFDMIYVGLILGVTPRMSPEGMVVMEIDAEKSSLAPEAEAFRSPFPRAR